MLLEFVELVGLIEFVELFEFVGFVGFMEIAKLPLEKAKEEQFRIIKCQWS